MTQIAADTPIIGAQTGAKRHLGGTIATMVVLAVAVSILAIGAWLEPNPEGSGTHIQLGLAPCSFIQFTGIPCGACGMTTAVSHAAHGHLIQAFLVQPAGALFALAMAVTALICAYSLIRNIRLAPLALALARPKPMIVIVAIVVVSWIYKAIIVAGHH